MDTAVFATLKKLIGKKTDSTDETVNGKLNTVINNTSASTSANAGGTISQKLSYLISSLIGTANASGGSATAGTVMSKLNALQDTLITSAPTPLPTTAQAVREFLAKSLVISFPKDRQARQEQEQRCIRVR